MIGATVGYFHCLCRSIVNMIEAGVSRCSSVWSYCSYSHLSGDSLDEMLSLAPQTHKGKPQVHVLYPVLPHYALPSRNEKSMYFETQRLIRHGDILYVMQLLLIEQSVLKS